MGWIGRRHWPEYGIEAAGVAMFMVAAGAFTVLLEHPASPVRGAVPHPLVRRALMGLAMGTTAVGLIYSPWGRRSGAHLNPTVTLTFWRLGRVAGPDAAGYVVGQFAGGAAGMALLGLLARPALGHPAVRWAVTVPGARGTGAALAAEAAISFGLMLVVLAAGNHPRLASTTGLLAGLLVASYITFEAPLSGMSMNAARTVASGLPARVWTALWIYLVGPPLGMLAAAEVYLRWRGAERVYCAKLSHHGDQPCPFRCRFRRLLAGD